MMPKEWKDITGWEGFYQASTGYFTWELRDQGLIARGQAPTIYRCLTEIARARMAIEHHVTHDDPHPARPPLTPHPSPEHAPIPQVHPPRGNPLPAQQDVPTPGLSHPPCNRSTLLYLHPSESG